MCGICGIYNHGTGRQADEAVVRAMTAEMTHRGPDDDGFLFDGPLALGMRRLSIIDIEGGAQPIAGEDGTVSVVLNGEIYNFQELRRELASYGHVFRTRSDTEAVVHAYEQWGLDALARLNGMFGVAIWDAREQRLVVARDPFGVKPLYWWEGHGELAFASEVKPLLRHPDVPREVDRGALAAFVEMTYVPAPRTAFAGIGKLIPGYALVCGPGGVRMHRFAPPAPEPRRHLSDAVLVRELRDRIARAVERQMVADVPVGVMLSGGIDSATVATIMTACRGGPIETFTVGFAGDFAHNELDAARDTARRIGARHHDVTVSAAEFNDFLPRSIRWMEEPVATSQTLPYYKVCELAREHVTVVLTGQGADEPFAGYPRHLGERYGSLYRAVPEWLRRSAIGPLVRRLPRNEQLKRAVESLGIEDPLERMRTVYRVVDEDLEARLLGTVPPPVDGSISVWQGDVGALDDLNKMLYVDARTSLADNLLLYGDKMAMAVSLEARVPYLDLELMTFAESLPAEFKIRGREQKRILKQAMAAWLPPEVIARKKIGFTTPIDQWLRTDLRREVEERLLSEGSACREFFDAQAVSGMLADHESGRHDFKRSLFALLTFEIWHEQFIRAEVVVG